MVKGEIWWAKLPVPRRSEAGFDRPVIVLQADDFNRSNISTVICAAITSNLKLAEAPGNVLIKTDDSNLSKTSVINVSQILTLDKNYLVDCVGTVNTTVMKKLEQGLKLVLDL